MKIAKSHPEGDGRLVASIVILDRYISPMIEISAKFALDSALIEIRWGVLSAKKTKFRM